MVISEPECFINEIIDDNHIVGSDTNLLVKTTNSGGGQNPLFSGLFVV